MRLFVDHLTNLDFSYLDATRGLVGETWIAHIELEGSLDEQGMVFDFSQVKKNVRMWLDTHIDHMLLVPSKSSALHSHAQKSEDDAFQWRYSLGTLYYRGPRQAQQFIPIDYISPANVAEWCVHSLSALFPESVKKLRLQFSTEAITGPFYHYSHGLKKHLGNCQRIAHGHRSRLEIWENGEPADALMELISREWRDIYIGSRDDSTADTEVAENLHFEYEAQQGKFYLSLPAQSCYLIDSESTVERIAEHLAQRLKQANPASNFTVKAYEGLAKGAIVSV